MYLFRLAAPDEFDSAQSKDEAFEAMWEMERLIAFLPETLPEQARSIVLVELR